MRHGIRFGSTAMLAGLILATAAWAWACTPQPRIFAVSPVIGPAGTAVTVEGNQAPVPGVPVEIKWNGAAGPTLAEDSSTEIGDFSTTFKIPNVEPGIYTVIVAAGETGIARASFEVIEPSASTSADGINARTAGSQTSGEALWGAAPAPQYPSDFSPERTSISNQKLWGGASLLAIGLGGSAACLAVLSGRRRARVEGR